MTLTLALSVSMLAFSPVTSLRAGPCDFLARAEPIQVNRGHIGPYQASATLVQLRDVCSSTVPTLASGFESVWAALDLSIGELTVLAGQSWLARPLSAPPDVPNPVPDWSQPPNYWVLRGCGAQLPSGVSSCGTWADLKAAFGVEGSGSAEFGPVRVHLDALPGFELQLDVTNAAVGSIEVHQDLSRIPDDAQIEEIVLSS